MKYEEKKSMDPLSEKMKLTLLECEFLSERVPLRGRILSIKLNERFCIQYTNKTVISNFSFRITQTFWVGWNHFTRIHGSVSNNAILTHSLTNSRLCDGLGQSFEMMIQKFFDERYETVKKWFVLFASKFEFFPTDQKKEACWLMNSQELETTQENILVRCDSWWVWSETKDHLHRRCRSLELGSRS